MRVTTYMGNIRRTDSRTRPLREQLARCGNKFGNFREAGSAPLARRIYLPRLLVEMVGEPDHRRITAARPGNGRETAAGRGLLAQAFGALTAFVTGTGGVFEIQAIAPVQ